MVISAPWARGRNPRAPHEPQRRLERGAGGRRLGAVPWGLRETLGSDIRAQAHLQGVIHIPCKLGLDLKTEKSQHLQ